MHIRFSTNAPAHIGARTLAARLDSSIVGVEGPLLSFHFTGGTLEECLAELRELDAEIGQHLADASAPEVIAAFDALKREIATVETALRREFAYKTPPTVVEEAAPVEQGSQLQADQHASNDDSPSSNDAAPEEKEENTHGSSEGEEFEHVE